MYKWKDGPAVSYDVDSRQHIYLLSTSEVGKWLNRASVTDQYDDA